jgi:2-C-methyl-D-erythritol 4-phosphate cytidylyltransferase
VSVAAVIVAAGSGKRYGDPDKVFATLGDRTVLARSIELFRDMPEFGEIVVVLGEHSLAQGRRLVAKYADNRLSICVGGASRSDSVRAGLTALRTAATLVAVHDAARPLATPELVNRVLRSAREHGAAVPSLPMRDTVQEVDADGRLRAVLDRERLRAVQTPQIARRDWLIQALAHTSAATDEGSVLFLAGFRVQHVEGEQDNIKLTWPFDLALAEALLATQVAS